MLKWLRRSTRSWFIYLAIGAIVVVFIFWGVGSYKASRSQEAAEVNGAVIPMTEFSRQYSDLVKQYQERTGGEVTPEMIKALRLKEMALSQLVEETLLLQAGRAPGAGGDRRRACGTRSRATPSSSKTASSTKSGMNGCCPGTT